VDAAFRAAAAATSEREASEARRRLEALIQEQGRKLEELDGAEPIEASGKPEVGQRVRIASGGSGKVVEVREDGMAVVVAGAMKIVVPAETLVTVSVSVPEGGQGVRGSVTAPAAAADAPSEIDLRGMRVDEALAATEAAVDAAVLADHPFLRIIHGMGTGAVREAVRRVLAADRRVIKFDFAPRQQGGTGVTVAEFEQ
jgi:DNA mismatch repair protein MutS2